MSFRLSEDEYEQLQKTFVGKGAHSLSDFVRVALARLGNRDTDSSHDRSEVRALARRLKKLDSEVKRLSQLVGGEPVEAAAGSHAEAERFTAPATVDEVSYDSHSNTATSAAAASASADA